ncbi:putative ribonuclease H-like domain-containing protein, partial [Tanacetum coccineum]
RKKDDEGVIGDQERPENSTQGVNTAGTSINTEPDMFSLGDNATLEATHANFFGDETEVDMSNITTTYPVPSTPNTRIHKNHSLDHVIGDVQSGVQTRRMKKTINEQEFFSAVYKGKTHKDLHTYSLRVTAAQMDVKSASLYGKIEEEVYVCQPPGFEDPEFPDRVYKVEKTLYGLHQAPRACYLDDIIFLESTKKELCTEFEKLMHKKFQMNSMGELTFFLGLQVTQKDVGIFISQDMYVDEILKKFGFLTVKTTSTPMETSKPLMKDENAEDVDVHLYRSTIVSLMYLTSSRPDIMFAVCTCVRFHVIPKVSHLHVVKRIFRYLKGQPKLGLWYHKDSPFDLEAYTDSDYASASLDRKSTTGGCQFLGSRLILWQCKKQTIVANSTTEVEYMAAASCCRQLRIYYSKTKHIEIRHHFIRDSNEKKLIQMIKIHTDQNVTDLLTKAFDVGRFQYLIARTTAKDEIQVSDVGKLTTDTRLVDGKKVIITETSVRRALQLKDAEVLDLEKTKISQAAEITKLKERVKKLERRNKSRTPRLKRLRKVVRYAQVVSTKDEGLGAQEDASKQGRKIADLDANAEEVEVEKVVSTAEVTTVSATTKTVDELTLAQTLIEIKVAKPKDVTTAYL